MNRKRGAGVGRASRGIEALVAGLVVVAMGAGCATGGVQRQEEVHWVEDIGRVTLSTFATGLDKVVRKYSLQMAREVTGGREVRYETTWVAREVVPSESARGVTHARNRIVIQGHSLGTAHRMTWEVENEVSSATAEGWHPDVIPAEVVETYRPVYSDLMLEVRTGLIR